MSNCREQSQWPGALTITKVPAPCPAPEISHPCSRRRNQPHQTCNAADSTRRRRCSAIYGLRGRHGVTRGGR